MTLSPSTKPAFENGTCSTLDRALDVRANAVAQQADDAFHAALSESEAKKAYASSMHEQGLNTPNAAAGLRGDEALQQGEAHSDTGANSAAQRSFPTPGDVHKAAQAAQAALGDEAPTVVVLVGPPGAGKSTIGRRLARAMNSALVDSDVLIEQAMGKSCGEVFTELGEPKFREVEAEHVARALRNKAVVSLGGGAVITESTRELLANHLVVWIDVSVEEGARRTAGESSRPVLQAEDPVARYRELIEQRLPFYREVADYRARTDGRSPQQVVADILGFIESSQ